MIRAAILAACTSMLAACSQGMDAGNTMEIRGYAFAPPAFKSFCERQAELCSTAGSSKVVKLTPTRRAELSYVNRTVNSRIAERSDISTAGKTDVWRLPSKQGDCEDFAIMKKSELIKRGWPRSALLLTVGWLGMQGHTVLTVRTSEGDLILDNRTSAVRNWSQTSLRYFARQSQSNGRTWERIGSVEKI